LDASEPVRATGRIFQRLIFRGLTQAQRAVCISSSTRDLLIELAPALKERTTVVHFGQNFPFHPVGKEECDAVRSAFGLGSEPYFLHVGQNHRRKNRVFLLPLLAAMIASRPELPHRLVLVGSPLGAEEEAAIAANGLGNRVFALGKVGGEELRALYGGAAAMIFPSLLEGFGWPIIEAQACGCPVVTSDRRPMNEIGGDAALYIDPLDHQGSAQTLLAALPTLSSRRDASLRNAASFSVETMVDHYLAEYSAAQMTKAPHNLAGAQVEAPQ
jgi:glycosyltransferase involved in cell wall biosynthesis